MQMQTKFTIFNIAKIFLRSRMAGLSQRFPVLRVLIVVCALVWLGRGWLSKSKSSNQTISEAVWIDDKYTIVIATYKRVHILPKILTAYTAGNLPNLHSILLVWQDTTTEPPIWIEDFSREQLPVLLRKSKQNSMNERFRPDNRIKTEAIFMVDDDLFIQSSAIERAFNVWKEIGRNQRIVGFTARDYRELPKIPGQPAYGFDLQPRETYSMVLSNAAFMHRSFFNLYWEERYSQYRLYVDKVFNCDDLLINFLVSNKTGLSPILVQPSKPLLSYPASGGLVNRPDHWPIRSACVDNFAKMMGRMPLRKINWSISEDVIDRASIAESDDELVEEAAWEEEEE